MKFNFKKAAALFLAALTLSGVSAGATSLHFADGQMIPQAPVVNAYPELVLRRLRCWHELRSSFQTR